MRRREFITLIGGAAAWPLSLSAQQTKVYRIGALLVGNADVVSFRTELREELRKAAYVEGRTLLFEFRSAERKARSTSQPCRGIGCSQRRRHRSSLHTLRPRGA